MPERPWAPWRLSYVKEAVDTPKPGRGCLFCSLPARPDAEAMILRRSAGAYVMLNAFPYCNGHLLVVPTRHTGDLRALEPGELLEANQLIQAALGWLQAVYQPHAFNIGINMGQVAGAGIPDHLHWHIVPRWSGDVNFMTVTADTRVLPQSLPDSYAALRAEAER